MENLDQHLAFLVLRAALGLNILMHGLVRLRAGSRKFSESLVKDFEGTPLTPGLVAWFGYSLPPLESILGFLLLMGLFTQPVLLIGGMLIILLILGKSFQADWQTVSFQMIYVLIYAILLWLRPANYFSVDTLIFIQ
ncbi:MAG: DoxX family membrane protein [Microscillaceae bacterium]|nr:DoxX family membrane protein [Microscillaceae bacterium]